MIREAVLFIPPGEHRVWIDILGKYAAERGYTIVAVVADFGEAVSMWSERRGRKLIIARLDMTEDLEIVTLNPAGVPASQRRPQRMLTGPRPAAQQRPQLTLETIAEANRPHLRMVS